MVTGYLPITTEKHITITSAKMSPRMARLASKKLKHTGTVCDYVEEFTSLMLDIRDISEEDKLFNFVTGL